jgi:tRNA-2-methylthio-N6-dimethylallyladenosine synthase
MRRGHTRAEYLEKIDLLRSRVPELALSTDVIVGYPGETERDFLMSLDVLDQVGFDSLFFFMYSPRPGTTAGRQPDDVPVEEKRRRLRVVSERQQRAQKERNERRVGLYEEVLVDTLDGPGRVSGRTPHFRIVHFDGPEALLGRVAEVEITGAGPNSLTARLNQQATH